MEKAPISRRLALAAGALHLFTATGGRAQQVPAYRPLYTAQSAPDRVSRLILARPLAPINDPVRGTVTQSVHQNFARVIEQNAARMDAARLQKRVLTLPARELTRMAILYRQSARDGGRRELLTDVYAAKLSPVDLARLTPFFGFESIYESVVKVAREKTNAYQLASSQVMSADVQAQVQTAGTSVGMLEYTLEEIYLSYRTAPIGSLGVRGAIYETAAFAGKHLTASFSAGFLVGTGFSWLLQAYWPEYPNWLGGVIYDFVESIHIAPTWDSVGDVLYHGAGLFNLDSYSYDGFAYLGGDYGITVEWSSRNGGGDCSRNYWVVCNYV